MLDPRLLAEQPDVVRGMLEKRNDAAQLAELDRFGELDARRKELIGLVDEARATRNKLSPQIGKLYKEGRGDEAAELKARVAEASKTAKASEGELKELEEARKLLLMGLPNLLDERVPAGTSEHDNELIDTWAPGELKRDGEAHDELAARLGWLDGEAAARIAGARFSVLRGDLARLERCLVSFFCDLAREHGYEEVVVPYVVWRTAMEGTGQLPKFEDDAFKLAAPLNGQDAFLIPTAEVPVTNLHRGEILSEDQLPLNYTAFTPCFRSEAGSYGRDTRGLIRQHQFHKVELVKVTTPEQAAAEHEALTSHAEACLRALGLPYQKKRLCGGDIGFGAYHCYDLEVWLPGQNAWREISSCSNYGEFQARRMNLRYRPSGPGKQKPRFCHTINGSALAVGRTVVAILENYADGDEVIVPERLRPYLGGQEALRARQTSR